MSENYNDDADILKEQEQEADLDTANEDNGEEQEVDWEAKAKKAEQIAENQRIRAEKAEAKLKAPKDAPVTQKPVSTADTNVSLKDQMALINAKVSEDDIDDVVAFAQFKKISIADALKTPTVKAIIAEKSEFRKTAEVTNTSNARKTSSKVSDESLVSNLAKGVIPEKGSDEAERIFWARRGGKR